MEELTIGDVARRAGIRTSAIRYYESVGLLPTPRRVNGHRRYDPGIMQRLAMLQLAQQAGFTVAEIGTLLHGFASDTPPSTRWKALAERKIGEADGLIRRAQRMKELLERGLQCGCLRLEDCLLLNEAGKMSQAAC